MLFADKTATNHPRYREKIRRHRRRHDPGPSRNIRRRDRRGFRENRETVPGQRYYSGHLLGEFHGQSQTDAPSEVQGR